MASGRWVNLDLHGDCLCACAEDCGGGHRGVLCMSESKIIVRGQLTYRVAQGVISMIRRSGCCW